MIFEGVQMAEAITFWEMVDDGAEILVNENGLLMEGQYSQVVYFNSSFQPQSTGR